MEKYLYINVQMLILIHNNFNNDEKKINFPKTKNTNLYFYKSLYGS